MTAASPKFRTAEIFAVLALVSFFCIPAFSQEAAQHGPLLAAVVPRDNAVNLYRVNGMQLELQKSLPIPGPAVAKGAPSQMCLNPAGTMLFVGSMSKVGVMSIDLKSQTEAGFFSDEGMKSPDGCVVSPDGKKLYMTDRGVDAVFVFATGSHKLLKKIPVAKEPRRGLFLPNGKLLVTSGDGNMLNVIDPVSDTIVRSVKAGVDPRAMALTPDGKQLAITNTSGDVLAYYDPSTLELIADYGAGKSPQAVMITADGKTLYALSVGGKLIAIAGLVGHEPGRTTGAIPVQGQPIAMAAPPDAGYIYISLADGTLAVADTSSKTVTAIPDAKGGGALAFRP